jgi:hypothetical protein
MPGSGKCINLTDFSYVNATFNILSYRVIIALLVPVISKLQLPIKTKLALCGLFTVGMDIVRYITLSSPILEFTNSAL